MEEEWCNLSHLAIHDNSNITYHIVVKETILSRLTGICNANIGQVLPGMLVQAVGNENEDALRVKVYCKNPSEIWYHTEWKCYKIDLLPVSSLIWNLLCAVSSLADRVRLAKNKQFCKDVENIRPNSKVWFCPDSNNLNTYLASVKCFASVKEFGDGYYLALDLLENSNVCKPSPLTQKYFKIFNSPGTFTTLSNINPRKTDALDEIRNFEKKFLSSNILQPSDSFFASKAKEIIETEKSTNIFDKNKCSSLLDSDNNNENLDTEVINNFTHSYHHSSKISIQQQEHDSKQMYRNLKSFDPLNSDDEAEEIPSNSQQSSNTQDLNIGSCVKVLVNNDVHYGVIRWIGSPETSNTNKMMAAIELDDVHPLATDGTYQNIRYFQCKPQRAWFTDLKDCYQYDMAASKSYYHPATENFQSIQSSIVTGAVPPICVRNNLDKICGKFRGIQGHHNSCYLDATLFSMFAFTSIFDRLLFRPANEGDCLEYEQVQRVLREEIVNPLRKDLFVGADHVMKLRTLLDKSSSISGLTTEEKDPEEFLTSLLAQTLKAEPFLVLSSGQDSYFYQLFVEKDEKLTLPNVQQLLEQSFLTSNIKLAQVPSCFIIQMPRFGKAFKMYSKIQPTLLLDVTDIIDDSPRQCTVCGKLAKFECKECFGQCGEGLESTAFCNKCLEKAHSHEMRTNHKPRALSVPLKYEILKENYVVPRLLLELLAVVCIETSHYVSFVKCGPGSNAPWCFFDSMADRKGEQNGYNIPEMVPCPDFPYWLSEEGANYLSTVTDDKILPEHAKRLLCDAYMCMYQSPDVIMYK
ncbi:ubiquitin carboxyl-terminal hydrolase CYLD [Phymastichus coffea]|uniref:ubiquitin carboxyl-terminal hydrolase CYLD n=1 Tax=Phymastichus coffea TaxID=108790 RepID=UPI00273CAF4E|nr:ubiquitin carboxyl-terminal hydrolase CYLD [Phymastichus coffea]